MDLRKFNNNKLALVKSGLPYIDDKYPAEAFCMEFKNKADVVQVKHGKWIDVPLNCDPDDFAYKYNLRTKCSVCDYAMPREYPRFKICPCCGTIME